MHELQAGDATKETKMTDYSWAYLLLQSDLKGYHKSMLDGDRKEAWDRIFSMQKHIRELEASTVDHFASPMKSKIVA